MRLVLFFSILFSLPLVASESYRNFSKNLNKELYQVKIKKKTPLQVYLGTQLGLLTSDQRYRDQDDRSGYQFNFKLLGSYQFDSPYVFDLGVGTHFGKVSSKSDHSSVTLYGEASLRYSPLEEWQVGVVTHFMPMKDIDFISNNDQFGIAAFAGVGVYHQLKQSIREDWKLRFGGKVLSDLNISGYQSFMILADVQLGFDSSLLNPKTL